MPKHEGKLVAQNRKARHDYTIIDTIEAGMVLQGTEIKSIRGARINLKDGYQGVVKGEFVLVVEGATENNQSDLTILQEIDILISSGVDKNEAIKQVAHNRNLKKNDVYQEYLKNKK